MLVAKKDGSVRVCVDFRALNLITKKDGYPLPRIEMCLDVLRGAKVFSIFDLYGGFHQFGVKKSDREKVNWHFRLLGDNTNSKEHPWG